MTSDVRRQMSVLHHSLSQSLSLFPTNLSSLLSLALGHQYFLACRFSSRPIILEQVKVREK